MKPLSPREHEILSAIVDVNVAAGILAPGDGEALLQRGLIAVGQERCPDCGLLRIDITARGLLAIRVYRAWWLLEGAPGAIA